MRREAARASTAAEIAAARSAASTEARSKRELGGEAVKTGVWGGKGSGATALGASRSGGGIWR
jgi:hypothetical protein